MDSENEVRVYRDRYHQAVGSLELDPAVADDLVRRAALEDPSETLVRAMVFTSQRLASVVDSLGATSETLQSIADAALNPTATRSEELRRRAAFAIENGWNEEASADLDVALEANPYDPISWYLLGRARVMLGQLVAAGEAYFRASKYGAPKSKSFSAFALLATASALDEGGQGERAIEVLREGGVWCAPCPEVGLALSRRTGAVDDLAAVFRSDSTMIVDAITIGALHVDEAAEKCYDEFGRDRIAMLKAVIEKVKDALKVVYGGNEDDSTQGPWVIGSDDPPKVKLIKMASLEERVQTLKHLLEQAPIAPADWKGISTAGIEVSESELPAEQKAPIYFVSRNSREQFLLDQKRQRSALKLDIATKKASEEALIRVRDAIEGLSSIYVEPVVRPIAILV